MSEVRAFFRFCPSCGRRFHIRLMAKKLVEERKEATEMKQASVIAQPGSSYPSMQMRNFVIVEQNVPLTIDIEKFEYTYKCKHCGHVWSELRTEESKV
jgi:predicted RNA-binding Zn-ribbon protein involved in translation (DUF1610 family)